MMPRSLISFSFFLTFQVLFLSALQAEGIRGKVTSEKGEPLAFATIYVKQTGSGTVTNEEGFYEIRLSPGRYDLIFQYLGYQSKAESVVIGESFRTLDVSLKVQIISLETVEIGSGREDPAYTIMRKAIAKAKYHLQQLDSYTAQVYIKGTGRVKKIPWLLRKPLAKEGIDTKTTYISESVSEVSYIRPNTFTERVISVKQEGNANASDPTAFINGSFYNSELGQTISPLSPKAFAYYRFELLGSFFDQETEVNKIRVIPRSKGGGVFSGTINIVEDQWSIHSLDLSTTMYGFLFDIQQIYKEIQSGVWLPVSHNFDVSGKVFGFDFEYDYLATISRYQITLNPELPEQLEVIDEKVEQDRAAEVKRRPKSDQLTEQLASGKELTRKELRQLMKEYEKQELKESKEPAVVSNRNYTVDSLAHTRDSTYWSEIRPVPLTQAEIRGHEKIDSLILVAKEKEQKDSIKQFGGDQFEWSDLLFGGNYRVKESHRLRLNAPLQSFSFNTVEGFHFDLGLSYKQLKNPGLEIGGSARYALARRRLSGFVYLQRTYGKGLMSNKFRLEGGRYISQFNRQEPIAPWVNALSSLLLEENHLRLYERDYLALSSEKWIQDNLQLAGKLEWAERYPLQNNSNTKVFNFKNKQYLPNEVRSFEWLNADGRFVREKATILQLSLSYWPFQKYRIRNDKKSAIKHSSPRFTLLYRNGLEGLLGSRADFEQWGVELQHHFRIGIRGTVDFKGAVGGFFNTANLSIADYQHFMGNRTPIVTTDPVGSFRLLEYYYYSTKSTYVNAHLHYQFRKFLLTQSLFLELLGLKENLFVNYLNNTTASHYFELGYGLDGLSRFFRLEFVAAFQNGGYDGFGIRIGVSTNFNN